MKKIFIVFLTLFLSLAQSVSANGAGLPPFFKINGKLAISNPLQTFGITAQSFLIPQDYAPENYVINQPIDFEIDETALQTVVAKDFLKNTKYSWDFGDGTKTDGIKNTHTYEKMGSHILVLTISVYVDPNQPPTKFIDSFLINVLPTKDYQNLPQAVIKINGNQVKDPWKNLVDVNFQSEITYDASNSKTSSQIIEYLWNFGDGQTSNQKVVTHSYSDHYYETVVLRVKDKNGFFSDAFVGLKHNTSVPSTTTSSSPKYNPETFLYIGIIIIGVILFLSVIAYWTSKKRK